ncbi:hypothetical protein LZC95_11920 [Pendulispora brunnea]|uniref:Uncharacterized protein n=1 Tax=Pendulispora brunnea TaxID=2905690 RepID=A0ABZ2KIX2_9BACT
MRTTFGKRRFVTAVIPLFLLAATGAACSDFNTNRVVPDRKTTVGEDLYGILCDRVAAQVLREDLNGSSFSAICHKSPGPNGTYADDVDQTRLPPLDESLKDVNGQPVPLQKQKEWRDYAMARIHAMVRRRASLIAAFDATFPNDRIAVVDEKNEDATKTCNIIPDDKAGDRGKLTQQLSDMLGKLQALYNDGTIPRTTQAVARVMDDIRATDPNANATRDGLAQFESRRGYKPDIIEQGAMRPVVAYPQLRNLSNAALRLLSWDSDPYALNAPRYGDGKRIPVPGPAHAQFAKMLEVTHEELRTFAPEPWSPAPTSMTDAAGRPILSRPRTTLEVVNYLLTMQDPIYAQNDGGAPPDAPLYLVTRDSRGYSSVTPDGFGMFTPDAKDPKLPAIDFLGRLQTKDGKPAPSPFPAVDGTDAPARDQYGRALAAAGGAQIYGTMDTSQTFANALMKNLPPLIDPDVSKKHETLMDAIAGLEVLMGARDNGYKTVREYAPDPKQIDDWKVTHPGEPIPPGLGSSKVAVNYDAYHRESAALLDLMWALGTIAGDPTGDDVLSLAQKLVTEKLPTVARLTGTGLAVKAIADKHPEADIPEKSTLWDEIHDVLVKIAQDTQVDPQTGNRLLEDMLNVLADPSLGLPKIEDLGTLFSNQMKYSDLISYDRDNLSAMTNNGLPWVLPYNLTTKRVEEPRTPVDRSKPDSGLNRSLFQRFAQLVTDAHNVTVCNSDGAVVHAKGTLIGDTDIPINILGIFTGKPLKECSFTKIDDAATFFLDSIVHKADLYVRYDDARLGINVLGLRLSPATVSVFEKSSAIRGFWQSSDPFSDNSIEGTDSGSRTFLPTPRFLTRLQFFDFATPDTKNATTARFIKDLFGRFDANKNRMNPHTGTQLCKERVIPDPCIGDAGRANACQPGPNPSPDGMIHHLRDCEEGQWLDQRDDNTLFITENFRFFELIKPLLLPFTKRNREDIFIDLMTALNKHWQSSKGTAAECVNGFCTKDGASSYEALLSEQFVSDLLPAVRDILSTLKKNVTVPRCTSINPTTHKCAATENADGFKVLVDGTRILLDPALAKARNITNRDGSKEGLRNDGTKNPQVTPMYLVLQALNKFDQSFADWSATHPNDNRLELWRRARSQLVDQFLTVNGTGANSVFANRVTPPLLPKLIQLFREQLLAHCPDTFATNSSTACAWAKNEMTQKLGDVTSGPLFGSILDVTEAVRQDANARSELAKFLLYMTNPNSVNEARKTMLTTLVDFPQLLADDSLAPLIRTLSEGAASSLVDAQGNIVQTGVVDAVTALLARLSGRAFTAEGVEHCGRELDPNQVLTLALQNLVKPMPAKDGKVPQTPLEVIIDAIAEVNRVAPDDFASKLQGPDYGTMMKEMSEFMLDKQRGLEQFYEIIRQGTVGLPN